MQLLHVPNCPLLSRARAVLRDALVAAEIEAGVEEIEGAYPSPSVLVEGIDVTGRTPASGSSCRLDLPTQEQLVAALQRAAGRV